MLQFYPAAALAYFWGHLQKLHHVCVHARMCMHARAYLPFCMASTGWNSMKFYFGDFY